MCNINRQHRAAWYIILWQKTSKNIVFLEKNCDTKLPPACDHCLSHRHVIVYVRLLSNVADGKLLTQWQSTGCVRLSCLLPLIVTEIFVLAKNLWYEGVPISINSNWYKKVCSKTRFKIMIKALGNSNMANSKGRINKGLPSWAAVMSLQYYMHYDNGQSRSRFSTISIVCFFPHVFQQSIVFLQIPATYCVTLHRLVVIHQPLTYNTHIISS